MAISVSDFQNKRLIIDMAMNFAKFKPFVQRARDDIETSSEDLVHLVRNIKTLQDVYLHFQSQNIPGAEIVALLGSAKVNELTSLRNALAALKSSLEANLTITPSFSAATGGLNWPPVDSSVATAITPALDAVLAIYE